MEHCMECGREVPVEDGPMALCEECDYIIYEREQEDMAAYWADWDRIRANEAMQREDNARAAVTVGDEPPF